MAAQKEDADSVLSYYKKLIALRKNPKFLETFTYGAFVPAYEKVPGIFAYKRLSEKDGKNILVIGNYGDSITFGQYIQTRYIETQAYFSATLYEIDIDNAQALRVERTHNGYYVVDIPNDDEGLVSVQYYDKTSSSNKDLYYYPLVVSGNS